MRRYLQFILRYRIAVILVITAITAVSVYSVSHGVMASSVIRLFFGENPAYARYRELADQFAGNDVMVVAFEDDQLFEPEGAERLRRAVAELRGLSFVRRVESLESASRIKAVGDDLEIEPYLDLVETSSEAAIIAEVTKDPMVARWLVSPDGRATLVLVELSPDPDRPIEALPELLVEMEQAFVKNGYARDDLHMAGIVVESTEATVQARFTMLRLFPITAVLLALVVFVLFLRIWPVILTGGVALIAILWTFGLAIAIDPNVNLMMAMVPGLVTVIAFSDIIHLYAAFARQYESGVTKAEAVLESGVEVGPACLYTSATTFVGFASLAFIPTPIIRQLGVVLGAGVGIALLLALTLVPIVLLYLPGFKRGGAAESSLAARAVDAVVQGALRLSTRFPKTVLAGFAVMFVVSGVGISRIQVEASFAQRLDPSNHVRVAQDFIRERFAGASFVDLYFTAPEGKSLLDGPTFARIAQVQTQITEHPEVDQVLSLVNVIDVLHRQMTGATAPGYAVPAELDTLSQYLLLFEVAGGAGLDQLIDDDRRVMRMSVRLASDGLRSVARIGDEAALIASTGLGDGIVVEPTGITYLFGVWVSFILDGQKRGLLFAVLSTALMMMLCLRSFRIGLVSMLPNLLPLLVLGGYVGLFWETTDSDTMVVATFAIGIAVDDTIHFLNRLRYESERTDDRHEALERTFQFTGRAIVQTTLILCLGFLPFAASDYFTTRIIGTLLPMTLFVALVADLLMVPALAEVGLIRFPRHRT